jgi:tagatose-1,6-bisphosphate aldolase non-catalytic subunit AgaZ/GatZ
VRWLVSRLIELESSRPTTLLAVCPNSRASLEAGVLAAVRSRTPMLFAATLNQVDLDGGYTGWTPESFAAALDRLADHHRWSGPLIACLDHGGPWLKDLHRTQGWSLAATTEAVRASLLACLEAGYRLLHIDATVDMTLPPSAPAPIEQVVRRTVDLIRFSEAERQRRGLPLVDYEVGTEEVHGGLADEAVFAEFLRLLQLELTKNNLSAAWPCFIVGKVGTDLHTTFFDPAVARRLHDITAPIGSLIKGHYTDWVANPQDYPASGMGGANVGPELTTEEVRALAELEGRERTLALRRPGMDLSGFGHVLEAAVVQSQRWMKWLWSEEQGLEFSDLAPERRTWLVETGARYVWARADVLAARNRLYENLQHSMPDPHQTVVERVAGAIERYLTAFNLTDSLPLFDDRSING